MTSQKIRIAYLVTHPIQYQAPMLRRIALDEEIDLHVFYQSDFSTKAYVDRGFGRTIEWDVPLLGGYAHTVLPRLAGTPDKVTALLPANRGLSRALRTFKPHVLWVHGYVRPYNIYACLLALTLGAKPFMRDDVHRLGKRRVRHREAFKSLQMRLLSRLGVSILAIGKLNADYFEELGVPRDQIFIAPYAVDNAFFQQNIEAARPRQAALRRELGLDPTSPVALYVGKLHDRKRPDDLLEAYARVLTRWPAGRAPPSLLYAGTGEMLDGLKARAEGSGLDRVRFLGFQNQAELAALYGLCDVFVMPSATEPWGLVVNEVMNAAKPVIVTDEAGCWPDLVEPGANGWVVKVGDVDALATHLATVLTDPELAARMGRRSLEIINRWDFEADVVALKHACRARMAA